MSDSSPPVDAVPLVSVITVVLNGESTITRCIESVLAQTYANVEHIIVDGGSTDQTVSILRSYGGKIALWISEPDKGIYNAINKAINLARGEYYIHLGCDDIILPNGIEILARHLRANLVICGKVRYVDLDTTFKELIYNHSAGILINIQSHAKLGMYDESYRIAADTKFLQLAERASYVLKIEETVGEFTFGGASSNYRKNVREHARAMQEAGSWGAVKAFLWRTPRLLWSIYRS
jgi:glycosyltransferase involved in cell wall biosynthesis